VPRQVANRFSPLGKVAQAEDEHDRDGKSDGNSEESRLCTVQTSPASKRQRPQAERCEELKNVEVKRAKHGVDSMCFP
jgi:hypothetical protein